MLCLLLWKKKKPVCWAHRSSFIATSPDLVARCPGLRKLIWTSCSTDEEYCEPVSSHCPYCAICFFIASETGCCSDPPAGRMGSHNSTFGGRQGIALCNTSELEINPRIGLSHAAVLCVCLGAIMAADERLCDKEPFIYCPFGWTAQSKRSFQEPMTDQNGVEWFAYIQKQLPTSWQRNLTA